MSNYVTPSTTLFQWVWGHCLKRHWKGVVVAGEKGLFSSKERGLRDASWCIRLCVYVCRHIPRHTSTRPRSIPIRVASLRLPARCALNLWCAQMIRPPTQFSKHENSRIFAPRFIRSLNGREILPPPPSFSVLFLRPSWKQCEENGEKKSFFSLFLLQERTVCA